MSKPFVSAKPGDVQAFAAAFNQRSTLEHYTPIKPKSIEVTGQFRAYSSPDSTYAVTQEFFAKAQSSIFIGIYDFTYDDIEKMLMDALSRHVEVTLMLDLATSDKNAVRIFHDLAAKGAKCVRAPSQRTKTTAAEYFKVAHEKFIVIDGEWLLLQSGNWSKAGIPPNRESSAHPGGSGAPYTPGNREMGVAVRSTELASFFTTLLKSDIKLETDAEAAQPAGVQAEGVALADVIALAAHPSKIPEKRFDHKDFTPEKAVTVLPVLTPDNYLPVISVLLKEAKESILIEQQYVHAAEPEVATLCKAIQQARTKNPKLDLRIIVAPPFGSSGDDGSVRRDLEAMAKKFGFATGTNVRLLNHQYFVHCHNKLIIVDGKKFLISSQNWSDPAVTQNREAGLLIDYPDMAKYYKAIFEYDWETGVQSLAAHVSPQFLVAEAPESGEAEPATTAAQPPKTRPVALSPGDYDDV